MTAVIEVTGLTKRYGGHAVVDDGVIGGAEKAGVGVLFKPIDIEEFLAAIPAKLRESNEHQAAAKSR